GQHSSRSHRATAQVIVAPRGGSPAPKTASIPRAPGSTLTVYPVDSRTGRRFVRLAGVDYGATSQSASRTSKRIDGVTTPSTRQVAGGHGRRGGDRGVRQDERREAFAGRAVGEASVDEHARGEPRGEVSSRTHAAREQDWTWRPTSRIRLLWWTRDARDVGRSGRRGANRHLEASRLVALSLPSPLRASYLPPTRFLQGLRATRRVGGSLSVRAVHSTLRVHLPARDHNW